MQVKVIQGKSLKSPITSIVIELDSPQTSDSLYTTDNIQSIKKLVDEIKNYHPVFMHDYTLEGNTLQIFSKLTHLWIESAPTLNQIALGEKPFEEGKLYLLQEVIRRQVLSMSTIPLLHSAQQKNLEITQFYMKEGIMPEPHSYLNRHYCIGCGRNSHIIVSFAGTGDSHIAQKSQKDKWLSNTIIERLGLPLAQWQEVKSKKELAEVFETFPKPFVLKPTGLVGGSGVSTGITTLEKANEAYDYAVKSIEAKDRPTWQRKIMIQKQVEGEDYRILVVGGKVTLATKRIPAYVIGDGVNNLRQLIIETNKDPRRNELDPTHVLKPIDFDEMLDKYLDEQGFNLDYIPQKDENVRLRKPASMSLGGITEDFTDKVHPQIKIICETIASSLHAFVLGVDVLCKDISQPLDGDKNGSIIEINTMPEAYLNAFPVIGRQYPEIGDIYLERLLSDRKPCKRVVTVGKQMANWDVCMRELENHGVLDSSMGNEETHNESKDKDTGSIGVYQEGSIYINGEEIKSGLTAHEAREALKINGSLGVIVFAYTNRDELEQVGSGFDEIDFVISEEEVALK